jgi:predicted nucleic-acid-binding protein
MLDTNVVLDKLLKRERFYDDANKLFLLYAFADATNYISANMLTDMFYLIRKSNSKEATYQILDQGLTALKVCNITAEDGLHCLSQRWDDFEDCLVARCAENISADYIITRNKKDFEGSTVPALTPTELFELLEDREGLRYQKIDLSEYLS